MSARARLASRAKLGRDLAFAQQRIETLEAQLRQRCQQEERLLHEMNHRVSNNLAVLLGIVDHERAAADEGAPGGSRSGADAAMSLKLSRVILALAVAHRMLSETGWRPLRLATLCRAILESVSSGMTPALRVRVTDSTIEVSSRVADRIAIVLSELALNSSRHCQECEFVDVDVRLRTSDSQIVFEYRDSGPGYPSAVLADGNRGGGLGLVSEVMRHGLDGSLTLSNAPGATVTLSFSAISQLRAPGSAAADRLPVAIASSSEGVQ